MNLIIWYLVINVTIDFTSAIKPWLVCYFIGWNRLEVIRRPSSITDIFKYHLCLRSALLPSSLKVLSDYTNVNSDKQLLCEMSKSKELYRKWKMDKYGIVDILRVVPSLKIDSSVLVYLLNPLQPRYTSSLSLISLQNVADKILLKVLIKTSSNIF